MQYDMQLTKGKFVVDLVVDSTAIDALKDGEFLAPGVGVNAIAQCDPIKFVVDAKKKRKPCGKDKQPRARKMTAAPEKQPQHDLSGNVVPTSSTEDLPRRVRKPKAQPLPSKIDKPAAE